MDQVYLFTPGDSKRKMEKAIASCADVVIIDLEDGVSVLRKDETRRTISSFLTDLRNSVMIDKKIMLRINPLSSPSFFDDLRLLGEIQVNGIMIPKCEGGGECELVQQVKPQAEILPLIETARGLHHLREIAAAGGSIRRVAFGSVDYALDLGVEWTTDGEERKYAMGQLVYMSRILGLEPPIDAVFPLIDKKEAFVKDAQYGKQVGFYGKLVIHPDQIDWVRGVYELNDEKLQWSQNVVKHYEENQKVGSMQLDGHLIDLPVYKKAKRLLSSRAKNK